MYSLLKIATMKVHLFLNYRMELTPLMVASQDGHTSTVDVLLRNGADPNIAANVSAGCLDHEYGSTH